MGYSCVVVILFNMSLYKSAFSGYFFEKPVFHLFVFCVFCLLCFEFDVIFKQYYITFLQSLFISVPNAPLFCFQFIKAFFFFSIREKLWKLSNRIIKNMFLERLWGCLDNCPRRIITPRTITPGGSCSPDNFPGQLLPKIIAPGQLPLEDNCPRGKSPSPYILAPE